MHLSSPVMSLSVIILIHGAGGFEMDLKIQELASD